MNAKTHGLFQHEPELQPGTDVHPPLRIQRMLRYVLGKEAISRVRTPAKQWSYAVAYRLNSERIRSIPEGDALIVECHVQVQKGALGIGVTSMDNTNFISHERTLFPKGGIQQVRLWVGHAAAAGSLVFRSTAPDGVSTEFELVSISAEIMRSGSTIAAPWLDSNAIPLSELARVVSWAQTVWDNPFQRTGAGAATGSISIVDADQLDAVLGAKAKLDVPRASRTKSLSDWKMETDDAPILRYLWQALRPTRHLEFGTWEGFGASLVASVTDAEIWTINLAEGESGPDGKPLYAETDSGSFIGRLYRQAGYGHRVHQILCDSRAFDTAPFESCPMDTVLIDGGHTPEVVASDTQKALRILRPGGACVWHDFCPDPEALRQNLAPLGVVQAVVENFASWAASFERLIWIRKSWILVGVGHKT